MEDDFWTHDVALFDGIFRHYSRDKDKPRPVRAKIHVSEEKYFDHRTEIIPLSTRTGVRTYVMMHPYVFEPKMILTVGLYKKPRCYADGDDAIGEVISSQREGIREVKIGNAQAWYYQADKILVLWECFFDSFARGGQLLNDVYMAKLWQRFEEWLLQQFPETVQIATPFSDPLYPTRDYQEFLRSLGYELLEKHPAFVKLVK